MNLRKLIALLATLIMMSGTAFAAPAGESAQAEEVTLNWLGIGPGIQRDAEEVWALWNEELQAHLPGVTVEFELHPPYEYADRFKLAMAANEQIDVANRMWMMNFFQEIDRGALMPLNDLLDEFGQGVLDAVPQFAIDTVTFDGNIYNIPTSWAADWRPGFPVPQGARRQDRHGGEEPQHRRLRACNAGGLRPARDVSEAGSGGRGARHRDQPHPVELGVGQGVRRRRARRLDQAGRQRLRAGQHLRDRQPSAP